MSSDRQEPQSDEPVAVLLAAAASAIPLWLRRCVDRRVLEAGRDPEQFAEETAAMAAVVGPQLLAALEAVLEADVEAQRVNPLSLFRQATAGPTAVLQRIGVEPPHRDQFAVDAFPDDLYDLAPANWADIDETLREPGLVWGAWKAMTVIRRHRPQASSEA